MKSVEKHFDQIAKDYDSYKSQQWYFYNHLKSLLKTLIPKGKRVLEVGCGTGDLLAEVKPAYGVGIDISSEMINIAKRKHPSSRLHFFTQDVRTYTTRHRFDFIFMADVIEHIPDTKRAFLSIKRLMTKKTIFINTMANPIWEPILLVGEKLGLKMPEGQHNRIPMADIRKLIQPLDFKIILHDYELLCPIFIPAVSDWINTNLETKLKRFSFIEYFCLKSN